MSRAAVEGVTISDAYRIHADGKLLGFVWKDWAHNNAWVNSRTSERSVTRREAIEVLKALEPELRESR